jgi:predicted DNA-binding helix-hairpin-helix protein
VVDSTQWQAYFGPYAGRAFVAFEGFQSFKIDVSVAPRSLLARVPGIGEKTVEKILEAREQRGRFKTWEDLKKECPWISPKVHAWLTFPRSSSSSSS